jgi:hypothetical protein
VLRRGRSHCRPKALRQPVYWAKLEGRAMPKLLPGGRAVGVRPGVEVHHPRVLSTRVVRRLDIGRRPSKHAIESYFRVSEKRRCQMAAEKFRQWGLVKGDRNRCLGARLDSKIAGRMPLLVSETEGRRDTTSAYGHRWAVRGEVTTTP